MDKQPLVSVIVVCYNASEYLNETLESVKAQTYKNLELIVSDDCSNDGTADIARAWMNENKNSFVRTELITVDHNTGVSANYNRAVKACQGEWIKNVDGDDLLMPDCIQDNVEFVLKHQEAKLVFSNVVIIKGKNKDKIIRSFFNEESETFFTLAAQEQFKYLLNKNVLPSQSCFVDASVLKEHPYNEDYRGLEDAPMWVTLTKNGYKAYYFNKETAYYRVAESNTHSNDRYYSPLYFESTMMYFWSEQVKYIKALELSDAYNNRRRWFLLMEFADIFLNNKRSCFHDILFKIAKFFIYRCSFKL